jgi:putative ABC transport system permease protein
MLGIVIGVAAVIAMIALGNGAQKAVKDRISALGTTLLTIQPGQAFGMGGIRSGDQQKMTMDDAKAIEDHAEHILAVQPEMQRQLQIQYNNRNANTSIVGTTANYLEVRKYELEAGKMFTNGHDASRARVAVVGPAVAQLLGFDNPIALVGEQVRIRGIQFDVIGVLKSKGQGASARWARTGFARSTCWRAARTTFRSRWRRSRRSSGVSIACAPAARTTSTSAISRTF